MSRIVNWFDVKSITTIYPKIPIASTAGLSSVKNNTQLKKSTLLVSPSSRRIRKPHSPGRAQQTSISTAPISLPVSSGREATSKLTSKHSRKTTHLDYGQLVDVCINMKQSGGCFAYYFKHQCEQWRAEHPELVIGKILRSLSENDALNLAMRIKPHDYTRISPQTMMVLAGVRWKVIPSSQKQKYDQLRHSIWMRRQSQPPFARLRELIIRSGATTFNSLVRKLGL
ncbi:hypothetical protein E3P99_01889 [Wallemia hederae]|uniref:Uncharacterized protein n=1 Tax=Wallemia hederae TaxID=1540922 RepID=A0A4T0FSD2_9BASI|nr:hypothetical protein E3P99_01889 [Wallemia hederae]